MFPVLKRVIDEQHWLDTLGDPLQQYVNGLFSQGGSTGKRFQNFLNGVWLGHPLHPMLSDLPVGSWTVVFVLDTIGSIKGDDALEPAADIALGVGLAGALGSAVTGWTDWKDTYGSERKVGLLHGLIMVGTTLAYVGSLIARLSGSRGTGVLLSNTGFGTLAAGAYLGGDQVFDNGYPVNHTAFAHGPGEYAQVMKEADLQPNKPTKVQAGSISVLLVKLGDQVFALDDTCVHAGCSLAGGRLDGATIICPCHGSQYDLRDGSVINGPATMPEPAYDVRIQNGTIEVKQAPL